MVIEEYLRNWAHQLVPLPGHLEKAQGIARRLGGGVYELADLPLRYAGSRPFGSSAKSTSVAPLRDCDRILRFDADFEVPSKTPPPIDPALFLDAVESAVSEVLEDLGEEERWELRSQAHSVGLRSRLIPIHIDLVPVIARSKSPFAWLPERRPRQSFISIHPTAMIERIKALKGPQPMLAPTIRLAKSWRQSAELSIPSYGLELALVRIANRAQRSLTIGQALTRLWTSLADGPPLAIGQRRFPGAASMGDLWTESNVLEGLTESECQRIRQASRDGLGCLGQASSKSLSPEEREMAREELRQILVASSLSKAKSVHPHFAERSPWFQER